MAQTCLTKIGRKMMQRGQGMKNLKVCAIVIYLALSLSTSPQISRLTNHSHTSIYTLSPR